MTSPDDGTNPDKYDQEAVEHSSIPEGMTIEQIMEMTLNLQKMLAAMDNKGKRVVPNRKDRRAWARQQKR